MLFIKDYEGLVFKISIKGIEANEVGDDVLVTAGAGEVWDDFVKNYNKIFNAYVFKDMFPEILIKCANNIILNLVYRDESSCYGGGLTVSIINLEYMNNIPFIDIDTLIKDLQ